MYCVKYTNEKNSESVMCSCISGARIGVVSTIDSACPVGFLFEDRKDEIDDEDDVDEDGFEGFDGGDA